MNQSAGGNGAHAQIQINGSDALLGHTSQSNHHTITPEIDVYLIRGDYIQIGGKWYGGSSGYYTNYQIKRVG